MNEVGYAIIQHSSSVLEGNIHIEETFEHSNKLQYLRIEFLLVN